MDEQTDRWMNKASFQRSQRINHFPIVSLSLFTLTTSPAQNHVFVLFIAVPLASSTGVDTELGLRGLLNEQINSSTGRSPGLATSPLSLSFPIRNQWLLLGASGSHGSVQSGSADVISPASDADHRLSQTTPALAWKQLIAL